jgi:heme-degrading monooxygenase HmoA/quinol monooxygenase YgiN
MFEILDSQFKGWVVSITLVLSALLLVPAPTMAATAVSLDSSNSSVNVATVYKVDKADQEKMLSNVLESTQADLPAAKGFINAAILNGQDESEIIALSQWQDLPSFQTYIKQQSPNSSVGVASPLENRNATQTFACQVQHTETRATSPSVSQGDVIQFSQFKMKPNKEQSELAMVVSQMMPGALQMSSGLKWAAMCPSTDKSTIALLARWQSRGDFESLAQQPGFNKSTNYWQTFADNEHGLYDVVKVIR